MTGLAPGLGVTMGSLPANDLPCQETENTPVIKIKVSSASSEKPSIQLIRVHLNIVFIRVNSGLLEQFVPGKLCLMLSGYILYMVPGLHKTHYLSLDTKCTLPLVLSWFQSKESRSQTS